MRAMENIRKTTAMRLLTVVVIIYILISTTNATPVERGESDDVRTGEILPAGSDHCYDLGASCTGTFIKPCCGWLYCGRWDLFKKGTCVKCKLSGQWCAKHQECCSGHCGSNWGCS